MSKKSTHLVPCGLAVQTAGDRERGERGALAASVASQMNALEERHYIKDEHSADLGRPSKPEAGESGVCGDKNPNCIKVCPVAVQVVKKLVLETAHLAPKDFSRTVFEQCRSNFLYA